MLADKSNFLQPSGKLEKDIHLPFTIKLELVDFIAEQLPLWRDDPERPVVQAETSLTEQLCSYRNNAINRSMTWSHIRILFQPETGDEKKQNRITRMYWN